MSLIEIGMQYVGLKYRMKNLRNMKGSTSHKNQTSI